MSNQKSIDVRNARLDAEEVAIGASPILKLFAGTQPASCAAGDNGSAIASGTLPSDWMAPASDGVKSKAGTWLLTGTAAAGTGTSVGHYRLYAANGTTCHDQGSVASAVPLITNGLTEANSNILNFAATTGVVVGMNASGAGVPSGARVLAVGATTVKLSHASEAGVASGATITFGGDMTVDNVNIAHGQVITVASWQQTAANA